MNHLKQIIDQNYSTLPKSQVVKITVDICNQQMEKITNELPEKFDNTNEDEITIMRKANLYPSIMAGVLELLKENKDKEKINFAKVHTKLLIEILEAENMAKLENGNSSNQEEIINEIILPHYVVEWTLNNI